jgi:hypothetical protein
MIYAGLKCQGETPLDYQYTVIKKLRMGVNHIFSRGGHQLGGEDIRKR